MTFVDVHFDMISDASRLFSEKIQKITNVVCISDWDLQVVAQNFLFRLICIIYSLADFFVPTYNVCHAYYVCTPKWAQTVRAPPHGKILDPPLLLIIYLFIYIYINYIFWRNNKYDSKQIYLQVIVIHMLTLPEVSRGNVAIKLII